MSNNIEHSITVCTHRPCITHVFHQSNMELHVAGFDQGTITNLEVKHLDNHRARDKLCLAAQMCPQAMHLVQIVSE